MSRIALTPNASGTGTLTIAAPNTNTDRTLTLPDASGTVATTADVSAGDAGVTATLLGVGQTWQAVTRVVDTSYQNTTGRPIFASYYTGGTFQASTDNVTWVTVQPFQIINSANRNFSYGVIPNGHYYRLTGALGGSTHFAELR
jgi:hypothetical protein